MTPEPWLRGPLPGVHPLLAPILYSLKQAREDLQYWTSGLTPEQLWSKPHGLTPLGFHIRHIGGSIDRLVTYMMGNQLSDTQLEYLKTEENPGATLEALLTDLEQKLAAAEHAVLSIDPSTLDQPRQVGRRLLRSTVGGLLTHTAEHTQRHVGQAIVTAKLLKNLNAR